LVFLAKILFNKITSLMSELYRHPSESCVSDRLFRPSVFFLQAGNQSARSAYTVSMRLKYRFYPIDVFVKSNNLE